MKGKLLLANHAGAVTLLTSIVLLTVSSLIVVFSANQGVLLSKAHSNTIRNNQALMAAEAGMEYGINYLNQNRLSIISNTSGGFIQNVANANTTNVTLANNTRFTITFTNPLANNYNLISVNSTGTSSDGTSSRSISQKVQYSSLLGAVPTTSLSARGTVKLKHDAVVRNFLLFKNIEAASTVSIQQDAYTANLLGVRSTSSGLQSDVTENASSLSGISSSDFIGNYLSVTNPTVLPSKVAYSFTNSGNADYSNQLDGLSGTTIYINQTGGKAKIKNATIGSATNPVLLIINGKAKITGNTTIYGFVLVIDGSDDDDAEDSDGEGTVTKDAQIIGGMAASDNTKITKDAQVIYSSTVLNNLQNTTAVHYFAKVAGSWKDF